MKTRLTILFSVCICLLLVTLNGYAETLKGKRILTGTWNGKSIRYLEGEILVGLRSDIVPANLSSEMQSLPLQISRPADKYGFMKLRATSGEDLFDLIERVERLPSVRYAEPNMVDRLHVVPNDTDFGKQWHYHNTGQVPPGGTPDADVDAPEGWDTSTGSSTVKVGVIDSGIPMVDGQLSHPELDDPTRFFLGWNFVDSTASPRDDRGHGTHVTGIIAAETDNNQGIAGVSWNAKILAIKVFDSTGNGTHADFRDACFYAVDNGCHIINYSGGGSESATKEWGVAYADTHDVLLCAAAGNDGLAPVIYPAAYSVWYPNVVAVTATDHNDVVTAYSCSGPGVTVAAPGGAGGTVDGDDVYSTMPDYWVTMNALGYSQNYSYMAGTSMATPHVSGLAALILSMRPWEKPEVVRDMIKYGADDINSPGFDNYTGWGRINIATTLNNPPVPTLSQWCMGILILVLTAVGIVTMRKRNRAEV